MVIEKLKIELSKAYRQFGDAESDIKENVELWADRLQNEFNEPSTIILTDGTAIVGVDVHVAVRVASIEEQFGDETTIEDDKAIKHAVSCVFMVTDSDVVMLKHEYDIVDDVADTNLYSNQTFTKAELTDFSGDFTTIWP